MKQVCMVRGMVNCFAMEISIHVPSQEVNFLIPNSSMDHFDWHHHREFLESATWFLVSGYFGVSSAGGCLNQTQKNLINTSENSWFGFNILVEGIPKHPKMYLNKACFGSVKNLYWTLLQWNSAILSSLDVDFTKLAGGETERYDDNKVTWF